MSGSHRELALAHLPGWEDEKAWKVGFRLRGHSDSSLCFPESAEAESSRGQPRVCSRGSGAPKREGWVAVASECRNTATGIVVGIGGSDQGTLRARAVSMDPALWAPRGHRLALAASRWAILETLGP